MINTFVVDLKIKLTVNLESKLDFPTPESPIRTNLKRKSYSSSDNMFYILKKRKKRKRKKERKKEL